MALICVRDKAEKKRNRTAYTQLTGATSVSGQMICQIVWNNLIMTVEPVVFNVKQAHLLPNDYGVVMMSVLMVVFVMTNATNNLRIFIY